MGSRRTNSRSDSIAFRAALAALGVTQAKAADLFGVGERTVRRWCDSGPRGPAEILLRLLEDGRIAIADLEGAPNAAQTAPTPALAAPPEKQPVSEPQRWLQRWLDDMGP